ncbi:hypothetical protein C3L33_07663, partial [Rhododendron williamsianum]
MEEGKMMMMMMMMMMKEEKRIVVAGDESEESMYALSWCISNLILSQNTKNTTLFLLYVKPPPPVYSSLDPTDKGGKKGWNRDAKNVICAAVEKLGADILVMGSHDYGFFKRCSAKSQANCIGER